MQKKLLSLFVILCLYNLSATDDRNSGSPYPLSQNPSGQETDDSDSTDLAQDDQSPRSDSRWYKSRSGRQEYLKGGSDYPRSRKRVDDSGNEQSPKIL